MMTSVRSKWLEQLVSLVFLNLLLAKTSHGQSCSEDWAGAAGLGVPSYFLPFGPGIGTMIPNIGEYPITFSGTYTFWGTPSQTLTVSHFIFLSFDLLI